MNKKDKIFNVLFGPVAHHTISRFIPKEKGIRYELCLTIPVDKNGNECWNCPKCGNKLHSSSGNLWCYKCKYVLWTWNE